MTADSQLLIVEAPRPNNKDEALTYLVGLRNSLTERQRLDFDNGRVVECAACAALPGTPELCASCLANRYLIEMLSWRTSRRSRRAFARLCGKLQGGK